MVGNNQTKTEARGDVYKRQIQKVQISSEKQKASTTSLSFTASNETTIMEKLDTNA